MEFDEMKMIWDSQNNELLYGINEKALHNRILSKKKQAQHITNISELLLIVVNICVGCLIFGMTLFKQSGSVYMYISSAWMFASGAYVLLKRIRRIRGNNRFDRSMHGDLNYAISIASYQVSLSQLGRWNILPIGIFIFLGILEGGKSIWIAVGTVMLLALANYVAGWEHNFYKGRKRELEILQNKLVESDNRPS